jgi:hypothetical protein
VFVESVSLGIHLLTSSGDVERRGFPSAPSRYSASVSAGLSNNFLEVGHNFTGLDAGPIRFVWENLSCGGKARTGRKNFFLDDAKLNFDKRVKLQ